MKRQIVLLSSLMSIALWGQHSCGFDHRRTTLEKEFPETKWKREQIEEKLSEKGVGEVLKEYGFTNALPSAGELSVMSTGSNYTGQIYEIPVVVHIIESNNPNDIQLTDEQIQTWLDNANKMYATTYGNGFFAEGEGETGGAIIPFKLVLAKRTPNCQPTTGVVRYDASGLAGYAEHGLNGGDTGSGVSDDAIKALAPHWPEKHYYNIYVVNGIDGVKDSYGLAGWAFFPEVPDAYYDTFMKAAVVIPNNTSSDVTLAHEFGHALGLYHPFGDIQVNDVCPTSTGNCSEDDDKVCDTEPTKRFVFPASSDEINTCTGNKYAGVQYNIMNYTPQPRKFTAGQRDRALAMFLSQRGDLVNSPALQAPPSQVKQITLTDAPTCAITTATTPGGYSIGITKVQLGDIDNASSTYENGTSFYTDYSQYTCLHKTFTNLTAGEMLSITINKAQLNRESVSVWIDYNDDGVFDTTERVFTKAMASTDATYTHQFRVPTDAVQEKYLRMRVRGDLGNKGACESPQYGEVEDYAVRIVPQNWQDPDNQPDTPDAPPEEEIYTGRVGINTNDPKATLEISASYALPLKRAQGVSFPSFSTEERSAFRKVVEGTMIFNTTEKCLEIYVNNQWKCIKNSN